MSTSIIDKLKEITAIFAEDDLISKQEYLEIANLVLDRK